MALILMGGLAIDGGALSNANRECVQVASEAARAATDAGAERRAAGLSARPVDARAAAQTVLSAHPGVTGEVTITDGVVTVTTHKTISTTFLSLIRITKLSTDARSAASLEGTG